MPAKLTAGSIAAMMGGTKIDKPVVQILGAKKIQNAPGSSGPDRYRMFLSDGETACSFAMLASQLNFRVENGDFGKFSIIRIDNYVLNNAPPNKKIVVILDVEVLNTAEEVGDKIGNPVPVGNPSTNQDNCAPDSTNVPKISNNTNAIKNNNSSGNEAVAIKSEPKSKMPTTNHAPQSNAFYKPNEGKMANGGGQTNQRIVHSIANLTPYQNRWTIRARVTNKPPIRTWSNARGEGKLFSIDLLDESGEIRATGFNEQCDTFYSMIEMNKVYYISRASLKPAKKQFSSIKHDYEITFTNDTSIELCDDNPGEIPLIQFAFVPIGQLPKLSKDSLIDVVGVCKRSSDLQTIVGRTTNREMKKRDVHLVDQSKTEVILTIWGNTAEEFDGSSNPIVAVKGVKISDFNGCSLTTMGNSVVLIDPLIKEASELRCWFDSEGASVATESISKSGGGGGAGSSNNWKYLQQLKLDGPNVNDKPEYFSLKGTITFVKAENCMYMACPTSECNKKVIDLSNGSYRCEKCNREFDEFKWRFLLNVSVSDCSDNIWVTCFQETAETILDITAAELGALKTSNPDEFNKVVLKANFKEFVFRLRASMETFQDESRLKVTAVNVAPVNLSEYNARLIQDLKEMV